MLPAAVTSSGTELGQNLLSWGEVVGDFSLPCGYEVYRSSIKVSAIVSFPLLYQRPKATNLPNGKTYLLHDWETVAHDW